MFKFIKTSTTGVKFTFGKFTCTLQPGLNWYMPWIQRIDIVSNKTRQENLEFRIRTRCNSFSKITIAVQYKIYEKDVENASFSLDDPISQMSSYIENGIRSGVSEKTLEQLYESFDKDIGEKVTSGLVQEMSQHGYTITKILMTGIEPDKVVLEAINNISASEKNRIAAANNAQANYNTKVKNAEAKMQEDYMRGQGISTQREAIFSGYKKTITDIVEATGMSPEDIANFIIRLQKLDTEREISTHLS